MVTGGYKGLQRLQGVIRAYSGLQVDVSLTRTYPETFSSSILYNNKS